MTAIYHDTWFYVPANQAGSSYEQRRVDLINSGAWWATNPPFDKRCIDGGSALDGLIAADPTYQSVHDHIDAMLTFADSASHVYSEACCTFYNKVGDTTAKYPPAPAALTQAVGNALGNHPQKFLIHETWDDSRPGRLAQIGDMIASLPFKAHTVDVRAMNAGDYADPSSSSYYCFTSKPLDLSVIRSNLAPFANINTKKYKFFARVSMLLADSAGLGLHKIDVFDPDWEAIVLPNVDKYTTGITAAGLAGFKLDLENYDGLTGWSCYPDGVKYASQYDLPSYQHKTRLRGQQIMRRMKSVNPAIEIYCPVTANNGLNPTDPNGKTSALLGPMIAGLLDEA